MFKKLRGVFAKTNDKKYITVRDLDGRPVHILEGDLDRHTKDLTAAKYRRQHDQQFAAQQAVEAETRARADAERIQAGTMRHDH
jgi:hypothetical protein